jgi:hypothetical protein
MGIDIIKCDNCDTISEEQKMRMKEFEENQNIIKERKLEKYYWFKNYDNEVLKKLGENYRTNSKLLMKIDDENKILIPKMKEKIDQLMSKQNENIVEIGTGNSCNSPCYTYNSKFFKECPKCQGKVISKYENGVYKKEEFDYRTEQYREYTAYNEEKICTGFRFNNKIGKEDVDINALFEYFDKVDNEKIAHYSINFVVDRNTYETRTEEFDLPYHYMMIDGERFDFPYGFRMKDFFCFNEYEFFPKEYNYALKNCIFYEGNIRYPDIGQSLGSYGYAFLHLVLVFICESCGYKYHIVRISPFFFRDKSKDVK